MHTRNGTGTGTRDTILLRDRISSLASPHFRVGVAFFVTAVKFFQKQGNWGLEFNRYLHDRDIEI